MRRQTLLFLGAVVLPSVLVLALAAYAIRQEQELAEKRRSEDGFRLLSLVRQELLTRLEGIALRAASGQATPRDREVALVARLESGRLLMPWDDPEPRSQSEIAFDAALREAQEQLHRFRDPGRAAARLRAAPVGERSPADRARAELLLATCLSATRKLNDALEVTRRLLQTSPTITDEYGVPYPFYAAQRLRPEASAADDQQILAVVSRAIDSVWLSPSAASMAADLLGTFQAGASAETGRQAAALHSFAVARAQEIDPLVNLIATLPLTGKTEERTWIRPGDSPWMLGWVGKPEDATRVLVAVRTHEVLAGIRLPAGVRWTFGREAEGEALGEGLPGLKLAGAPGTSPERASSRRLFYLAALLVVLSVTAFSAWLLNRDVRREKRLAALRSQFVSSVSHELRTPISTIRAYAELLDMGRALDEGKRAGYLRTIVGESERLSRLVGEVLNFSRMEQGVRTYHLRPVAVEDVVRSAARELDYQLSQKGFDLRASTDGGSYPVRADSEALQEAIVNLLTNAIKYSSDRREIDLSLHRDSGQVVVRVRDYGIGIPAEHHTRIFQSFYRVPPPDGGEVPGAGLGLTIVDQIVRAHGGSVSVESQPGQGSTFSISLPVCEGG